MHEHEEEPDPPKLKQCVMFYILYFFCRRGQENLHDMTKETYSIEVDVNGKKYLKQKIDEINENHTADDQDPTNQGKMYENPGQRSIHNLNSG